MLLTRISDYVHQFAAVLQGAQFFQRQKRCSRKIGFHPQHAVKFNGMSDRFVNLQSELRALKNNVEHTLGTLISAVQGYRFFADPAGILDQLQFLNQLVALVLPLSPEGGWIGPLLDFASSEGVCNVSCTS